MTERGFLWIVLMLAWFLGCGARTDLQAGLYAAAGAEAKSGAGGAAANTGGSTNGGRAGTASGGSAASAGFAGIAIGSGGSDASAGFGASAGTSSAGIGGVGGNVGTGGSHAGSGGAHAGSGGTHAGSGGAHAGTGGVVDTVDWYVDSLHGSDGNPGTFVAPFKTLERAAGVADGGDTVWLFNGTYDETTEPRFKLLDGLDCSTGAGVSFAEDVTIAALNAGKAHLSIAGQHGFCLAGGQIRGLQFECGPDGHAIEVSSGEQDIQGTSFTNCGSSANGSPGGQAGLDVSGEARVHLEPGNLADYSGFPNFVFAAVRDGATLTVSGGTVSTLDRGFYVSDAATLVLQGMSVVGQNSDEWIPGAAVHILEGSPRVTLRGCKFSRLSDAVLLQASEVDLSIDQCQFTKGSSAVFALRPFQKLSDFRITVSNSRFESLDTALMLYSLAGTVDLSVTDSNFSTVKSALQAWFGGTVKLADVTISDCDIGPSFSAYQDNSAPFEVLLRRVSVTGCQRGGVSLTGDSASHFDLGTSDSPGENYLLDNQQDPTATDATNLWFSVPTGNVISAIGNTWDASTQGTDANGLCSVSGPGQTFDLTTASGRNFTSRDGSGGVLRLAESPH
ncbi:MAG TPA: DUF1565 domain-containing protein [Polyangiaceae bacterium]|nr:DUF1565 domain-containing protein [Polyangiaceae bacterium]